MGDRVKLPQLFAGKLAKFKYPALVLLLGLALVLWGSKKVPREQPEEPPAQTEQPRADTDAEYCARIARELEGILSQIDGAGRVRVMLTLKSGPVTQYQSDYDSSTQTEGERSSTSSQQKTVILSRGSAYNEAAAVKTEYPRFQGALIVSEGGGEPGVRFAVTQAVSALLGLGTDKITVVKSK